MVTDERCTCWILNNFFRFPVHFVRPSSSPFHSFVRRTQPNQSSRKKNNEQHFVGIHDFPCGETVGSFKWPPQSQNKEISNSTFAFDAFRGIGFAFVWSEQRLFSFVSLTTAYLIIYKYSRIKWSWITCVRASACVEGLAARNDCAPSVAVKINKNSGYILLPPSSDGFSLTSDRKVLQTSTLARPSERSGCFVSFRQCVHREPGNSAYANGRFMFGLHIFLNELNYLISRYLNER